MSCGNPASAANSFAPKNVLVLYSFSNRNVAEFTNLLESEMRAHASWPINFNVEYLESRRFDDEGYEKGLVETLRHEYGGQNLDLVIGVAYPALEFAARHRDQLFPHTPIVFTDVHAARIEGHKLWPAVTGVTESVNVRGTIDLALRVHPRTDTVVVITNRSDFDRYWLAAVHNELVRRQDSTKEMDFIGLPPEQLLQKAKEFSPQSVVLFQETPLDSDESAINLYDVLRLIGQHFPTYCIFPEICLGHGGIGGVGVDYNEQFLLGAAVANRVLSGERPEDIPVVHSNAGRVRVDWRELQRWQISESALPPGSEVLYRQPTFWERDKKYIVIALLVILAQAVLIFGLLWQRARKRKAEAVLRESEKRFRTLADTTPSLIWMADQHGKVTYLNSKSVEFTGNPNAGFGDSWKSYIHPDDLEGVMAINSRALEQQTSFSKEYRLLRHDGVYRWMFDVASPRVNGDGSFAGFIGSAIDITDQKTAQAALENVGGRLIEAQEKERSRIARDLHDDICQRLTVLSAKLGQVHSNGVSPSAKKKLTEIGQHCVEITTDIQSLSHRLHSSKLEYLGLVAGATAFCDEFSNQHEVDVHFTSDNVPSALRTELSLCLFRVMQEALHNALKYSGVTQFFVRLQGTAEAVQLEVRDAGAGFDVEAVKRGSGLGIVSMQERVHVLNGQFRVESRPGTGTRIFASVPLFAANADSWGEVKGWQIAVGATK